MIEPKLRIEFYVEAYDEGGYGDNRSQSFTDQEEAVKYARSLEKRFHPVLTKRITMQPIYIRIEF